MNAELLRTPLYDTHVHFGGKVVDFAGWAMPVVFRGIQEEHAHTRTACSVFDVSHMGRLRLMGAGCEGLLNHLCTRNLARAEVGRSYYSHMCREDGGILDDLIVSRFESCWGVICNASNRTKILSWITQHSKGLDVQIVDETLDTAMLAIQGPRALQLAQEISGLDFSSLKRYRFVVHHFLGLRIVVYRSGYTGEDGLEVVCPAATASKLVPYLLGSAEAPHSVIKPAGLGARDTLRLEAAMPLYGHELNEDVDSVSAGQSWCVDLSKDFIGAAALRQVAEHGPSKQLVGLELEGRRIARQHQPVLANGTSIGQVTSGTLSPTLKKSIAMAFVASDHKEIGTELAVELGGKTIPARVVGLPFYKRPA
ncbi:MAG: glycine cleavage system aminomethyltransferase GcvT [Planctomycetota bacterium]